MNYIKRHIESTIKRYLKLFPAVGITGPRQSGKTTLLQHMLKNYRYVSFDDLKMVEFASQDPEAFMETYNDKVIFDEVQKVPELFQYIKIAIDKDRDKYGKIILTGSSQFHMIKSITESLAGRIGLLSLLPLQYSELPKGLGEKQIFMGSYPEIVKRKYSGVKDWYASYISTYITRDVRDLANIGDLRDFQRFISLLAANTAQILNMSQYASDLGVSVPTIKRWISVLEASYIIFLLPPFYKNYGKRIIKSPKIYFYDTGLVSYLTGIEKEEHYKKGPMAGSIFENYIIAEIKKREAHNKTDSELFFFRTSGGKEIDLIIDRKSQKELIEIKHSSSFKRKMLETIEEFREEKGTGTLVYNGKTMPYKKKLEIRNYKNFLR